MENIEEMAAAFKALSDPLRLKLLKLLAKHNDYREFCVCDLAGELGISQPNVSHHLKILKSAGVIVCEKHEGFSYYLIDQERIHIIFTAFHREFLNDAKNV